MLLQYYFHFSTMSSNLLVVALFVVATSGYMPPRLLECNFPDRLHDMQWHMVSRCLYNFNHGRLKEYV